MRDKDMIDDDNILIVIPVYNGEKFLKETIDSCLQQTYKNILITIVNDCSTDSSMEVIKEYADVKNIKVIRNQINLGMNRSVNQAVKAFNSKFLLVLGQDDILPKDYIERALNYFSKDTAFVYCNPYIIDEHGTVKGKLKPEKEIHSGQDLEFHMAKQNEIMSTGLIMRRNLFLSEGMYDESYRNYGEWKLWIKLMQKGKVVYMKDLATCYRKHKTNLSNSFKNNTNLKSLKEQHGYWTSCRVDAIKNYDYNLLQRLKLIKFCLIQWIMYKRDEALVMFNVGKEVDYTKIKKKIKDYYNMNVINYFNFKKLKEVKVGDRFTAEQKVYCTGKGSIIIGDDVSLGYKLGGYWKGNIELQARSYNSKIIIKGDTHTNNNLFICSNQRIEIGEHCRIGSNCEFLDFDGHGIAPDKRNTKGLVEPILIGDNVWFGNGCKILRGTTIGKNCMVAAGSVVKGKFEDNCLIGGVPAKVIKKI